MPNVPKNLHLKDFKNFIIKWNNTFGLDRWYRNKYNFPFNSKKHRAVTPLDIFFEYQEDLLFGEYNTKKEKKNDDLKEYNITGVYLNKNNQDYQKLSDEEVDDWFDSLDIDTLNKNIIEKAEKFDLEQNINKESE